MSAESIYQHLSLGQIFFMPEDINAKNEGGTSHKSGSLACAFSLGIPIVGIKGDMNNRLLGNGKNIVLVDMTHKTALFDALHACFSTPDLASDLSKNATELYNNHLKWSSLIDKILATMHIKI
jgi:glycosyltransferase involved in cell wall biosynthesis